MNTQFLLTSKRLQLCPFAEEDIETLHALWSDPFVRKFLWDDIIIPLEAAQEVVAANRLSFEQRGFGFWNILSQSGKKHLGFCGLRFVEETTEIEILYGLWPEHWRKGFAREAATEVLRYGFEVCRCERVLAGVDPPNTASIHVMERLGMRYFQQMRRNNIEVTYFALTRAEWLERQSRCTVASA